MARSAAKRELRSFENSARNERVKLGFHFAGVGGASVWTYPIMLLFWFAYNAFTTGLPDQNALNDALGHKTLGIDTLVIVAVIPGLILAVIGIFRVKGRWWSIAGAALTWFLNPYTIMIALLPFVAAIPGWFDSIGHQITG